MNDKEYGQICELLWSNNQEFHSASRDKQIAMLTAWTVNVAGLCAHYDHDINQVMSMIPTIYRETLAAKRQELDQRCQLPLGETIN